VIDRIDLDQNSGTVIDYKSSSSPISLAEAQNGTNIQLPIYALAVERAIKPNAKVRNGHFLSINGAKSIGTIDFEGEKAAGLLDATVARIVETVASVKSGDFSVRPTTSKSCKTCVHKPVCRITDLTISESEEF
jgi:ATP-dependent helicase/DNAse subunit B